MPDDYEIFGQMWVDLNSEYTVQLWDESCLTDFPALKPVFDDLYQRDGGRQSSELYVQLADVVGYALVEKWGGVYVNCAMQPIRPLPELPDGAWASYENYEDFRIVNVAIGAPEPGNPFWRGLLDGLPARYFANPTTGSSYLTDYARTSWNQLHVLPKEAFNPAQWLDKLPEETIAVRQGASVEVTR